jgi:serine protease AprX
LKWKIPMKIQGSLQAVLQQIQAPAAWLDSRGEGIHIAVIDTGINGKRAEIPISKQDLKHSWPATTARNRCYPWQDPGGHGSMVAAIAAGNATAQGRYNGVAPDAKLISCRLNYYDTQEICRIYRHLIDLVNQQAIKRLVINNSYAVQSDAPPVIKPHDPLVTVIREAVAAGIVVVFPAGNNHVHRRWLQQREYSFGTIWGINSLDEVICVGTVDQDFRLDRPPQPGEVYAHRDSGRGPGQLARQRSKPDCVVPTYGEVPWGNGYMCRGWWGTSGAAAAVSGLAALMLARNPALTAPQVQTLIGQTCQSLPLSPVDVGAGVINCQAAVKAAGDIMPLAVAS